MHNYKKVEQADGSFEIWEIWKSGRVRKGLTETCSSYLAFLASLEADNMPEEIAYVAPAPGLTPEQTALARNRFTKQQIRRAMRTLGTEAQLDALLDGSAMFRNDWNDATMIIMNDPVTKQALEAAQFDVDAIKLQIAGLTA
jgi:hypothetical protein